MGSQHSNLPPRSEKHGTKKNSQQNNSLLKDIVSTLLYIEFAIFAIVFLLYNKF